MKGSCLCGAIHVEAPDHGEVGLCHCSTCRRWGGGPMFAVHCGTGVRLAGAEPAVYRSSDWAERGFCGRCGTHLFYRLQGNGEYILPAGLFQEQSFQLVSEIFVDQQPPYYALANPTTRLTGEQVFAQFAQG